MHRLVVSFAAAVFGIALVLGNPVTAQQNTQRHLQAPPLIQVEGMEKGEVPVRLQSAQVSVETSGSLARTTLLLTLYNPNERNLEGTLQFPLQSGQQVAGFALDVNGMMRDAVPVPKNKGQQVFESVERRGVDPALLEQTAGNHFRLRVYPLPPHGTRQLRLVLDEAMRREDDAWRLDVPVSLLAGAESFGLRVQAQGVRAAPTVSGSFDPLTFKRRQSGYEAEVQRRSFRAATALALHFPVAETPQTYTASFDGERYALAEIPLRETAAKPRIVPKSVGLLWDASASARKRDRDSEFALLDRYFRAMGDGRVTLRLFRDVGEDGGVFEVRRGDWSSLRKTLESAVDDGASNLSDWSTQAGIDEYLLVSDGLHNYGDNAFPKLREGQRLYALSSAGAQADAMRLSALADASGGRFIAWRNRDGLEAASRDLLEDGTRIADLRGDGISDLHAQSMHVDGGLLRVAGRLHEPTAMLHVTLDEGGKTRIIDVPIAADAPEAAQVAPLWASWSVASLAAEPELHRAAIARLGQQFGLVTPGTSLLVLDAAADYVRYDIPAPAALREEVAQLRKTQSEEHEQSRSEHLDEVADLFAQRIEWWEKKFPKGRPPEPKRERIAPAAAAASGYAAADAAAAVPPPPPMSAPAEAAAESTSLDRIEVTGSRIDPEMLREGAEESSSATISLQPWQPDSPYARRLRAAKPDQIYTLYLDERDSHANSTAFYLDVADLLLERGRRAEALRVLSNLAELELENRHVLRVLGYRLMQAEAWPQAVQVFRQVLDLADEEPQSHRDLGLALAAAGQRQEAIGHLYEVVSRGWDGRFAEVELVALNELNAIIATSPAPLDTHEIDRRLLRNLPLDLRVVLGWDSDNSDMDLWVTDPNGEKCYYSHKLTYQGGLISDDFTGGYGPEEYVLRSAKPGKYKVEANYFGDRQQIVTGATSLTLTLSTDWGTSRQRDRKVTLRLADAADSVLVGEFQVQ
ncbi:MAG TPA: VIT domain-containing protein [Lysobacter sp.]|jgi:Flp pilus assembly protein TadD|nr:VIT domain-containing protein [Lysobacter sp.]